MREAQKRFHSARMDIDKELYEQQIRIADAQIDRLVYDLYGLMEGEIRVVEALWVKVWEGEFGSIKQFQLIDFAFCSLLLKF